MNSSLRLARGRPVPGTLASLRRRAAGLGSVALVAAGLVPVAVAGAAPAVAATAPAPGAVPIAAGVLRGGDGRPLVGRVSLLIDPGAQPVGTDVTVPVVASTTTAADGRYQLAVAPGDPAVAAALARNNGWVNVMIVAEANGLQTTIETGRTTAGSLGALAPSTKLSSALPSGAAWVDRNGAAPSVDITLAPGRPGVSTLTAAQAASAAAVQPNALAPPCTYTVTAAEQDPTVVGELHKWKDTTATFSYGQTADSDIGVGVNATGNGWSLSGTVHIAQTYSATVGWGGWDPNGIFGGQLRSQFRYELRHWRNAPGSTYCGVDSIVPVSWAGGTSVGADVHQYDGHCDTSPHGQVYKGGGNLDRSSKRAYRYYGAVSAFGVGLDAQSGYSSFVHAHWDFGTQKTNHWMCGNDGDTTVAPIVYAGPNS